MSQDMFVFKARGPKMVKGRALYSLAAEACRKINSLNRHHDNQQVVDESKIVINQAVDAVVVEFPVEKHIDSGNCNINHCFRWTTVYEELRNLFMDKRRSRMTEIERMGIEPASYLLEIHYNDQIYTRPE